MKISNLSSIGLALCFAATGALAGEALPNIVPASSVGYANGGGGFGFSPIVPISVTALGYFGTNMPAHTVALWDSSGNVLAQADTTVSSSLRNQSYYEDISPVPLLAGSTYYIQAYEVGINPPIWVGNPAAPGVVGGSFTVSSDITYLGYAVGLNGSSQFPNALNPGNILLVGGNFQYSIVPEPATASLALLGLVMIGLRRNFRDRK